ncbi:sensor histidine kinase [Flavobacterium psychrotrophum]|uniref:sensor histidine kinase n=1 Tax=Flavobacterium psychrotrophum TaxID=2294119 RepID=UPI000E30E80D|nr:histidine kinase [Flavobacterium psychrotrophum]
MQQATPQIRDKRAIDLLFESRYKVLRHILLWVILLGIIFFSNWLKEYSGTVKLLRLLCVHISFIAMFYINMYVLVPRFFFRGQYALYFLFLLLLVSLGLFLMSGVLTKYLDPLRIAEVRQQAADDTGFYEGIIIVMPIILMTTAFSLFERWKTDNQRITELSNLTLSMELSELRNQINPHFLFNMLNGIKALVRSNPEKATMVIMKLSEFLRYQLYDNNEPGTPLRSEINFLSNFMDLEKLRRDNLSVNITSMADPKLLGTLLIPPNLFTTFAENAVKHSVDISDSPSYICMSVEVKGERLEFTCRNSKSVDYVAPGEGSSGLGLPNIKRRLSLLYGTGYRLDISTTEKEYTVILNIPI